MAFLYVLYLLAMAVFAFAIIRTFRLEIDPGRFARAVLPVFAVFVLWDVLAVSLGHWEFGLDKMLGIVVFNQPLEELAFFVIAPFMYVVIWEACKKFVK